MKYIISLIIQIIPKRDLSIATGNNFKDLETAKKVGIEKIY